MAEFKGTIIEGWQTYFNNLNNEYYAVKGEQKVTANDLDKLEEKIHKAIKTAFKRIKCLVQPAYFEEPYSEAEITSFSMPDEVWVINNKQNRNKIRLISALPVTERNLALAKEIIELTKKKEELNRTIHDKERTFDTFIIENDEIKVKETRTK
jgi:hypothetical protein